MKIEANIEGETITAELSIVDWREMCENTPQWGTESLPAPPEPIDVLGLARGTLYASLILAPFWVLVLWWLYR